MWGSSGLIRRYWIFFFFFCTDDQSVFALESAIAFKVLYVQFTIRASGIEFLIITKAGFHHFSNVSLYFVEPSTLC